MEKSEEFIQVMQGLKKNVVEHLSRAYADTIERNRSIILSIMDVIIALGQRGIPLKGSWKATDKDSESEFEDSKFNFFVEWKSTYDKLLKEHVTTCSENATFLSPTIQNQLINCVGDEIRSNIVRKAIRSPFISIMADETTDASTKEQISVCVRYLSSLDGKVEVHEDFLGFIEVEKTDAATLADAIIKHLLEWGVDVTKWRGKVLTGRAQCPV